MGQDIFDFHCISFDSELPQHEYCHQPIHQLHHTQRWALEHVHDPDRLQPLCPSHNELAHLGLIENENQLPEVWHLRANPDTDHPKYNIDKQVALYSRRGG